MNLKHKLCHIALCLLAIVGAALAGCSNEDTSGRNFPYARFAMSASSVAVEDEVAFTNLTEGGSGSYTFTWSFGDGNGSTDANPTHIYLEKGTYEVKLLVDDANGKSTTYSKVITVTEKVVERGTVSLQWVSSTNLNQIRSVSPALSLDGSRVYINSEDHFIRCYNTADGSEVWAFNMRNDVYGTGTSGNSHATPSVGADGTIYIGTGTSSGKLFALNPDGTVKWVAYNDPEKGFWNKGNAAAPYIGPTTAIERGNYVYIANRGSAGTCVCFDKNTGERKGFVTRSGDPLAGPAGGFQTDVVINPNGLMYLYCNTYGVAAVSLSAFAYDNTAAYMSWEAVHKNDTKCSGASAIDAEGNFIALVQNNAMTNVVCITPEGTVKWLCPITTAGITDQGGIVIAPDGTIYASMKMSGEYAGGIVAVNPDGSLKWHFQKFENVSSAPVVDRSGNIIFATEAGNLYIVAPDGQQELLAVDMAKVIAESSSSVSADWTPGKGKIWSSPILSDEGVIYFGLTNVADATKSLLVAVKAGGITGPASSGWPMRGHDARHSCQAN